MNLLYKEYIISKELVFCSFGFHLEDKSGKMKGMGFTELQLQLSGIGEWETDERKRSSVSSSKWRAARKSHLRFNVHVQSLFYFASYRCRSAAFFAVNRQGNNWWAIRTRLAFSISFITLAKYVLLSSCHANRGYMLNKFVQDGTCEEKVSLNLTWHFSLSFQNLIISLCQFNYHFRNIMSSLKNNKKCHVLYIM